MRRNEVEKTIRDIKENKYKMGTRQADDDHGHDHEQMESRNVNGKYWN